jgi:hypothetical protein
MNVGSCFFLQIYDHDRMMEEDQKWYHVDLELLRIKGFYFFTFAGIVLIYKYYHNIQE